MALFRILVVGLFAVCIMDAAAGRAATLQMLYDFTNVPDGNAPRGALVLSSTGALYGTTAAGGLYNGGTVFKMTPPAPGKTAWVETNLHSFGGTGDGSFLQSTLIRDETGALYGTTFMGGASGTGTVFKLTPPAAGQTKWTETILRSFLPTQPNGTNSGGAYPYAGALARDAAGNLYGTTYNGGSGGGVNCPSGVGVVYKLAPPAAGHTAWTETVLHTFTECGSAFSGIYAGLTIGPNGALYGAAVQGGTTPYDYGMAFMLSPPTASSPNWAFSILHVFRDSQNNDGQMPEAAPIADRNGNLYGTTAAGGRYQSGTVYKLTPPPAGSASWTETILYDIPAGGYQFLSGVTMDAAGALYGVTELGGSAGEGTAFKLTPPQTAGGTWTPTILATFTGPNGEQPSAAPVVDSSGTAYGTTQASSKAGTVYRIVP